MGLIYNISLAAFSSIGAFLFGYDSGVISSVITMEKYLDKFTDNNAKIGAVVATFSGGCFFGALVAGWTNDRFGRKRSIQLGCVFSLWGCAMQAGANNLACLLIGRIVSGFAIGILSMTVPLYNTEISPPKVRGFMVGLTQQLIGIGIIVANWVGYGCQFINSDAQWRLPLSLQLVPALLLLIGIQFFPNSPRWLLECGRDDQAHQVVLRLYDPKTPEEEERVAQEWTEMYETITSEALIRSHDVRDLWATPAMLRRTMVGVGVQVFCQFTGINTINYYGPEIYESLGITGGTKLLVQGIYGAVGPIANFFFITLILDRVGRKKPLIFGCCCFICTFSIVGAILKYWPPIEDGSPANYVPNKAGQRAGIAMIFLTSVCFSLSFGPVSWVLASEIFPTSTRAIGTAVATASNWAFNVLLSEVSPIALENIKWKFYFLFVALNAADLLVILLFFPETKGRTLEEMNAVFGDAIDAHQMIQAQGIAKAYSVNESRGIEKV